MAVLKIKRAYEFVNGARKYKIFIDNVFSGKIANGQVVELPINEGNHTVKVTVDWCSSKNISFEIAPDENKEFRINGSKFIPILLMLGLLAVYLLTMDLWVYAGLLFIVLFVFTIYYLSFGRDKYLKIMEMSIAPK